MRNNFPIGRSALRPASLRRERGLAIVEAALTLPFVLLLALGVTELGRATSQYVTLTAATRESARYLAAHALSGSSGLVVIDPSLASQVRNLAVYGNTSGSGSPVLPGLAVAAVTVSDLGGTNVGVATAYQYQPMLGAQLPTFGLGAPISLSFTLRAQVSMRAL